MTDCRLIFKAEAPIYRGEVGSHDGEHYTIHAGHSLCCAMAREIERLRALVQAAYREGFSDGIDCNAGDEEYVISESLDCWGMSEAAREVKGTVK